MLTPATKALLRPLHLLLLGTAFTPAFLIAAGDPDSDMNNPKRPGDASVRAETDDPTARREYMQQWYETPFTPEYMKWLNGAAARERQRNADMLPPMSADDATTASTADLATAGKTWVNLGPTKADVLHNGVTLHVTDSGRPVAIVTHPTNPDVVYLATAGGGVWKTTNAKSSAQPTWTPITESLGSLSCGALAMDPANPATLYLGLGDSQDGTGIGLTKTTNGGASWSPIVYLGDSTKISDIQVAHGHPNIVIAATDAGLFRSTNGGASFAPVSMQPLSSVPYCWSLAWAGGSNYALSLEEDPFGPTDSGSIWYSSDNGATWKKASGLNGGSAIGRMTIASSPVLRSVLYAEAAIPNNYNDNDLADFFRSQDGGHTWTPMHATNSGVVYTNPNQESKLPAKILNGQGWYNQLVVPSNLDKNTVYFGGALLLAKTTNALKAVPVYKQMTNWLAQFNLPYVHADFHAAAYDVDGTLYVGSDGGIFRSKDNGATWTDKLNIGIVSHQVYSIGSSEAAKDVVLGGLQDNGTRLRDGSTSTFNEQLGGDGFGCHVHATNPTQMLGSLYYDRIFKSTDGGSSFSPASSGIAESNDSGAAPFITHIVSLPGSVGGNTVFTHANTKVYKSTNYANSWAPLGTTGFDGNTSIRNVGVANGNGKFIGAVAAGGRVYLSNNGGASWTLHSPPNNAFSMSSVAFNATRPQTVYVSSVAPSETASHLWKSTDFGASWTVLDSKPGFPTGVPVNTILNDPNAAATLYAATHLGVYRSLDNGSSWSRYGSGLPLVNVTDFYISPNSSRMRIATYGRGFWQLQ